jgi:hypothetical protein
MAEENVAMGWNNSVAVITVAMGREKTSEVESEMMSVFDNAKGERLVEKSESFKTFMSQSNDLSFWMTYSGYMDIVKQFNPMVEKFQLDKFTNMDMVAKLNFENGQITAGFDAFMNNPEAVDFMKKILDNSVNDELIAHIPDNSI